MIPRQYRVSSPSSPSLILMRWVQCCGLAYTLSILGTIAHAQGDDRQALVLYEESLRLCRELGDKWGMAIVLSHLRTVAHAQGDDERATALYEESLGLRRELRDKHGLAECLEGLAGVAVAQQHLERAARPPGRCRAPTRGDRCSPVAPRACPV